PSSTAAASAAKAVSSNFLLGGQKLNAKKGSKAPTPKASTPVAGASTNTPTAAAAIARSGGPQPLRLPPNKLFFGYDIKPLKSDTDREKENADAMQPAFAGQGQTLRGGVKRKGDTEEPPKEEAPKKPEPGVGLRAHVAAEASNLRP
ncbi:hypothetical protein V491_05619, partial [Pseudogymnoascus sp. VKM F-3775]